MTGLNESKFISPQNYFILDLGYLNDQDYYKLIKYSMGIIYFPYKEGFGLPILDAIMLNKAAKFSRLKIIDGMNHVFRQASENRLLNLQTYGNPELPIHNNMVNLIADFIED